LIIIIYFKFDFDLYHRITKNSISHIYEVVKDSRVQVYTKYYTK